VEDKLEKELLSTLRDLLGWWRKCRIQGVVIGGVAAAFLGRPRATEDVDAIINVDPDDLPRIVEAARRFSLEERIRNAIRFSAESRMLLMRHSNSGTEIDLMLAGTPFEIETIQRSRTVKYRRLSVPLPTPEDYVVLKAIAGRSGDMIHLIDVLQDRPDLDYKYIRRRIEEFADQIGTASVFEDSIRLLDRYESENRKKRK
jgi:Nucleotidyl transferase of unknown function (DUF2204)